MPVCGQEVSTCVWPPPAPFSGPVSPESCVVFWVSVKWRDGAVALSAGECLSGAAASKGEAIYAIQAAASHHQHLNYSCAFEDLGHEHLASRWLFLLLTALTFPSYLFWGCILLYTMYSWVCKSTVNSVYVECSVDRGVCVCVCGYV